MDFKLSTRVIVGDKIKTDSGWRQVEKVNDSGAVVKEGLVKFGTMIYGWKARPDGM